MKHPEELRTKFVELRARNVPYVTIAAQLNINRNTAIRWAHKHKAEIDGLAALEAEAVRHKCFGSRHHEVEVLAKRLARLEAEIDQRNPQYMQTRELLDLIRATRTRLDQLCPEPALPPEETASGIANRESPADAASLEMQPECNRQTVENREIPQESSAPLPGGGISQTTTPQMTSRSILLETVRRETGVVTASGSGPTANEGPCLPAPSS